jgi:DNA polymerase II small subunit
MSELVRVQRAVTLLFNAGYHLEKEAFDLLNDVSEMTDPIKIVEAMLKQLDEKYKLSMISKERLKEVVDAQLPACSDPADYPLSFTSLSQGLTPKHRRYERARNAESDVEVIMDPTPEVNSNGVIEEYLQHFRDRFHRIEKLVRQRIDCRGANSLKDAFRAASRTKVKVICMITDRRETRFGTLLTIEDLEASTTVLIPNNGASELIEKSKLLLLDQVVCLGLQKTRGSRLIVDEVFFPDLPRRSPTYGNSSLRVALISDLHVGSKQFMKDAFNRFTLWLNGKCGEESRKIAEQVKYVVIAGDIVDGVGVYPRQINDLVVEELSKQYELAAKFLEQIPDYVDVIIIPGNHDATRRALPQPALSKEYIEPLMENRNTLSLGNPASIRIHGIEFLLYHGRSLDDVLATVPGMEFHSPERAMRLMLRSRHLAPIYGQRTLISPEKRDFLVIERVPDVFHSGHVHVMKYEAYRGTIIVNSGAWQRQTSYQKNLGLKPTPGIIPVLNLEDLSITPMDFN